MNKGRIIGYWICTAFVALSFGTSGAGYLARMAQPVEGVMKLGYPLHFVVLLGAWKVLGAVAILVPRSPRLKEWAYAGIMIDLTGAAVAHVANHSETFHVVAPLVIAGITMASWWLRPASRRLPDQSKSAKTIGPVTA